MQKLLVRTLRVAVIVGAVMMSVFAATAFAHHSFAMYDMTKTMAFTGVLTVYNSQANHAEIHFIPLGPVTTAMWHHCPARRTFGTWKLMPSCPGINKSA